MVACMRRIMHSDGHMTNPTSGKFEMIMNQDHRIELSTFAILHLFIGVKWLQNCVCNVDVTQMRIFTCYAPPICEEDRVTQQHAFLSPALFIYIKRLHNFVCISAGQWHNGINLCEYYQEQPLWGLLCQYLGVMLQSKMLSYLHLCLFIPTDCTICWCFWPGITNFICGSCLALFAHHSTVITVLSDGTMQAYLQK